MLRGPRAPSLRRGWAARQISSDENLLLHLLRGTAPQKVGAQEKGSHTFTSCGTHHPATRCAGPSPATGREAAAKHVQPGAGPPAPPSAAGTRLGSGSHAPTKLLRRRHRARSAAGPDHIAQAPTASQAKRLNGTAPPITQAPFLKVRPQILATESLPDAAFECRIAAFAHRAAAAGGWIQELLHGTTFRPPIRLLWRRASRSL